MLPNSHGSLLISATAKLKLLATPEQFQDLHRTQLAYRDALNYISQYAFKHSKMSNEKRLHEGTYYEIRRRFKLPSEVGNPPLKGRACETASAT